MTASEDSFLVKAHTLHLIAPHTTHPEPSEPEVHLIRKIPEASQYYIYKILELSGEL